MCGIVGFNVGKAGKVSSLLKMLDAVKHRGPDQGGYLVFGDTYLGHARLKVRGGDNLTQPFLSNHHYLDSSTRWAYSVNGELYNERAWRDTDCELVAQYDARQLIGEFAYAACNCASDETVLCRDRFGINPMYYYWKPGMYVFASEIGAIKASNLVPWSVDPRAPCRQFVNMIVPNLTDIKGIKAVPPGCIVTLTRDRPPVVTEYWDVPVGEGWLSAEEAVDSVVEQLTTAVKNRTKDTKVLAYVSSGMDGQIIRKLGNLPSITCDFGDGDNYREATHTITDLSYRDAEGYHSLEDLMRECALRSDRTIYNPIGVAKWKLSQQARELGYRVIVSGQGADELFCGYQFLQEKPWASLSSNNKTISHPAFEDCFGFTPQMFHPWIQLWEASIFHSEYDPFAEVAELLAPKVKSLDRITLQQYVWIKTHFESQILTWGGDRPEMTNSIEGRVPFLDLVDIAFSIRAEERLNKKVLRLAFDQHTPKRSFMFPYYNMVEPYKCPLLRESVHGALANVAYWQWITWKAMFGGQ